MLKKSLIILVLLLPIISSVEFDMKSEYSQGETLIARISGNFIEPILKENVFFYRRHVRIPMEYDIARINDEFYIYALLSKPENNYSISIENIKYMKGSEVSEEDITMNFLITNDTADFLVNPGFVITENDFFIEVQNLQDKEIDITIKDELESSVILKSGEIKKVNFNLEEIKEPMFKIVELSTENLVYSIPVYLLTNIVQEKGEKKFKLEPSELDVSLATDSETKRIMYLYNTGGKTLRNISLSMSESLVPYLILSTNEIDDIRPHSNKKIELYFSSDSEEKIISGQIFSEEEDLNTDSIITIKFIQDYIPLEGEEIEVIASTETCMEMGGATCGEEEKCNEELKNAKDDVCCLGTCDEIKKSSSGKIIGYGMIIIIIAFLAWFFKEKYRGAKKSIDFSKIGKGKK